MIDKVMMVLQNCMDSLKVEPGSYSETCPTPSHDGTQIIDIKVEEASDIETVKNSLLIPFPQVKAEHQVRCMSACPIRHISQISRIMYCLSHLIC
jgi:hypothetical protein